MNPATDKRHTSAELAYRGFGAAATGAGAAVLATAASACCVPVLAPLLVSVLGVSGAVWAAGLKPYSPLILAVAGLFLARRRTTYALCCSWVPREASVFGGSPKSTKPFSKWTSRT